MAYSFPDSLSFNGESMYHDSTTLLQPLETNTIRISTPEAYFLPQTEIHRSHSSLGNLIFTVLFLMVLTFVRMREKDLFSSLLNILWKRKKAENILNEGIASNLSSYILLLFLSFSVIANGIVIFTQNTSNISYILYIFGVLLLYHFTLIVIVKLLGWTFNARNTAAEVVIHLWTYHIMGGLIIAPFVIALFFVKTFVIASLLKITVISLILLYIIKFIRWIEILFAYRVSILYMILYLCAFEVMPLLVLYKLLA